MIPYWVTRSVVFNEFTPEEQEKYFGLNYKAVRPHIDTLYYTVSILGDENNTTHEGMLSFLSDLAEAKERKREMPSEDVVLFGLSVELAGVAGYDYRLRLNENFDIFIARYLPNKETPRIVVQLRTRSLVLDGVREAISASFSIVCCMCDTYGFAIGTVKENRFDYAYHTNIIQSPMKYFSDERMLNHLKSSLRSYSKYGSIGEELTLETLSLGMRKSNNIFFRCYDKTREVVEKGYKAFFIAIWQASGLISAYDAYVLNFAYSMRSFRTGILVGRIDWYLQYGRNEIMKKELCSLRESCFRDSDNAEQMEKRLSGVLPPVTVIMNIEFQTKRKFYMTCDSFIEGYEPKEVPDIRLKRLYRILELRSVFLDYLTSEKGVSFVEDRKVKDSPYLDWWRRIRACKIGDENLNMDLFRSYERVSDLKRTKNSFLGTVANFSVIKSGDVKGESTFKEDISDVLCSLNDNDFYGGYPAIRKRKQRQNRGIVKKVKEK